MNLSSPQAPGWKKPLLGCLGILGGVTLLLILAGVSSYFWLQSPGTQVPTNLVLGPESLAVVHIDQPGHDEGIRALVTDVLLETQRVQMERNRSELPMPLFFLQSLQKGNASDVYEDLERELPRDLTFTLEQVEGAATPHAAGAVNLNRFPRALRLFAQWMGASRQSGEVSSTAITLDDDLGGGQLDFVDNTLVWAQSSEALAVALPRFRQPETTDQPSAAIVQAYLSLSPNWDLRAVIENRSEALLFLADRIESLASWVIPELMRTEIDDVQLVRIGVNIREQDLIDVMIEAACRDEAAASRWERYLAELAHSQAPDSDSAFKMRIQPTHNGSTARLRLYLTNLQRPLVNNLLRLDQRNRRRPEEERD